MHRKLLLCLAFVGIALSACVGGRRNGVREGAESCDPSVGPVLGGDCCDANCNFRPATHTCSLGEKCFSQTTCTGDSATCPKAANFLPDADCDFAGTCHYAAKCDPELKDGTCLAPEPIPASEEVLCFPGVASDCTVNTYCDGVNTECPAPYAPATTICDESTGDCENDAYCPGPEAPEDQQYSCPSKTLVTAEEDVTCNEGNPEECTAPAKCNGLQASCPSNPPAAAGTSCGGDTYDAATCHDQAVCRGGPESDPESYTCDPVALGSDVVCDPNTASVSGCVEASYCAGSGSFDCVPRPASDETVCNSDTNAATCTGVSYCAGGSSFDCVPTPAETTVQCADNSDAETCVGPSFCAGGSSFDCVARPADSSVICNSGAEDPTTCNGPSHCAGGESFDCVPAPAAQGTQCRDPTACTFAQVCDGENTGCPDDTSFPDTSTDCSEGKCTDPESAKCDGNGNCGACQHPGDTADPLITGFHHQKFWFEGESGAVYNFFSQPGVAINSMIYRASHNKKLTVVGSIGFITATNKISFDAVNGPLGKFTWNNKNITFTAKNNMLDINDCVQMAWSPASVLFSSAEFEVIFAFKSANPKEGITIPYINTKFAHVSGDVSKMSGIIGFTATAKNAKQSSTDAKVSNILATDAAANTFTGATLSCEQGAKARSDNKMGAASKHQLDDLKKYSWAWA